VTGVQTCALPISGASLGLLLGALARLAFLATALSLLLVAGAAALGVTMTGANFTRSAVKSVTFNDVSASFIVRNATTIVAKVPVGATTGPIRVKGRSTTSTSLLSFKVWRFRP
jgi:hypothetical protein